MPDKDHVKRIRRELGAAGMTHYGQLKMTSRYLPNLIAEDEHIKGVIYGQMPHGLAMLIATDKRVIYLERHPGFTSSDDISYDVVAGVTQNVVAVAVAVSLHTRIGDYTLRFVNPRCADIFVHYMERRLEHLNGNGATNSKRNEQTKIAAYKVIKIPTDAREFLAQHDVGVLSTADRTGEVNGAVVYYLLGSDNHLYFLTKSETAKARNIRSHSEIALTVFDANKLRTVQIKGRAEVETDAKMRRAVFDELIKPREYEGEVLMPPMTQLRAGAYVPIRITPTFARFSDYKSESKSISSDVSKK